MGTINYDTSEVEISKFDYYTQVYDHNEGNYDEDEPYASIRIFFNRCEFPSIKVMTRFIFSLSNILWHYKQKYFNRIIFLKSIHLFYQKGYYNTELLIEYYDYTTLL